MACKNCITDFNRPGKLIQIKRGKDVPTCAVCGDTIPQIVSRPSSSKWDKYFHNICTAVASKSPCFSRKIGAILVRDKSIVSTGYNGPPRGTPHCGHDRYMNDPVLARELARFPNQGKDIDTTRFRTECPRRVFNYHSGTRMDLCIAQHAEENAVSNAARIGASTVDTILYMNSLIPCNKCFGTLINAGIIEIVVEDTEQYDAQTFFILENSNIKVRKFKL